MFDKVIIALVCVLATVFGAISGIGGGVIIKPIFDASFDMSVSQISFLSGVTVLAMSVSSLITSAKNKEEKIDKKNTTLLAVGSAIGGIIGKLVFDIIKQSTSNDGIIGTIQSILLVLLTAFVLLYVLNKKKIKTLRCTSLIINVSIGLTLGIISSFLGIGGGPINLVVLYFFFSMDTKTAAINSIYMIFFAQLTSLLFSIVTQTVPSFDVWTLVIMIVSGIVGGFVGRKINKKLSVKAVDILFCCMLITIISISVYNCVHYALII